ncbi:MAG: FAD-linked oxidoreductase [Halioglobus sp.]|jgi:FAD-linked oxidoreductase
MKRRTFVQSSLALGVGTALGTLSGCGSGGNAPQSPLTYTPGQKMPWINWAGNQSCTPSWRSAPASEDELVSALKSAKGVVRAVGAGHSFSGVVPTDDTLISTDLLSGLVRHDSEKIQATLQAGTRLHDMGPLLHSIGQSVPNMPDMDYPALGGAIANSVHATGTDFGSMSSYVTDMKLATVSGELLDCSAEKNSAIFQAARTSIGALGIMSEITLQNLPSYQLTEVNKVEQREDVFAEMDTRCRAHRHFECFPIPYSSLCITVATDIAKDSDKTVGEDDPQAINTLRTVFDSVSWVPVVGEALYDKILTVAMADSAELVRTGPAYKVFPHIRMVRFREMEYTVPAEAGPACVQEILTTIKDKKIPLCFPMEYRYVKADDIWLSMFEGHDGCSISVHQFGDTDYKAVFAEIEPIFWKYEGRPHWGKIHTLEAEQLAQLYPRHWQDFQEVRRELDPQGRLMNAHLKTLFGA